MTVVVYTDPAWAIGSDGTTAEAAAAIERDILTGVEIRLGAAYDGRFNLEPHRLADLVRGADAVVAYRAVIDSTVIDALRGSCRVIARQGVGTDTFDLDAISRAGIFAFNVPDYCVDETSTHALALLLGLERGIARQDARVKTGGWSIRGDGIPRRTSEASLGILGFGRIGRAFARKADPLFGRVLAFDPNVHADLMRGLGVEPVRSADELFGSSDCVSIHASLNESSRGLVNARLLRSARPGLSLVNTARGALVDAAAILDALSEGVLRGYGSDVYDPERPADNEITRELTARPDVISTCHSAFLSDVADVSVRRRVAEEVAWTLTTSEPPRHGRLC